MSAEPLLLQPPSLPLHWTALTHLPRLGGALVDEPLVWRPGGEDLVQVTRVELPRIYWEEAPPQLVFAEVEDPGEAEMLVVRSAEEDVGTLLFAGRRVPVEHLRAQGPWPGNVLVLPFDQHGFHPGSAAVGRAASLVVRRRANVALAQYWSREADAQLRELRKYDPFSKTLSAAAPCAIGRSALVALHVLSTAGLWWHGHKTLFKAVGASRKTVQKDLAWTSEALVAACDVLRVLRASPMEPGTGLAARLWRRAALVEGLRASIEAIQEVVAGLAAEVEACDLLARLPAGLTRAAAKGWLLREAFRANRANTSRTARVLGIGRKAVRRQLRAAARRLRREG